MGGKVWGPGGAQPPHLPQAYPGQANRNSTKSLAEALCLLSTSSFHLSRARLGKATLISQEGHPWNRGSERTRMNWAGVSEPTSGLEQTVPSLCSDLFVNGMERARLP